MKLSEFKKHLSTSLSLNFLLPSGQPIPSHFHITELGITTKHFIDCGGQVHGSKSASLQIWVADDVNHRLQSYSLLNIITLFENTFGNEDLEIEAEYQINTVGKYGIGRIGENFILIPTMTNCLALAKCNIQQPKNTCTPTSSGNRCC